MYNNVLDTIGNTPLVKINHMCTSSQVEIYAKLEGFNPTGSIKDRIALKMIEQAEADNRLRPGMTIVEPTSGNTGIALAMIGRVKNYKVTIYMSEAVSEERVKMIQAFGGQVVLTPADEGTDGAIRRVRELATNRKEEYFNPDQFSNIYNSLAHYETTANEIWEQTQGRITHFVSSIGTSGTIMGIGQGLKKKNPHIQIIEAQPVVGHYIQGLKNMEEAIVPGIYNPDEIDHHIMIDTEEAFATARRIVSEEGIFVGMSSGAAMLAALKVMDKIDRGVIVVILPDRGEKYLSTGLFI